MDGVKILTPEEVRERQMHCIEDMTCFVSLRKIASGDPVKAITHPDGYLSAPILVLKEYVH